MKAPLVAAALFAATLTASGAGTSALGHHCFPTVFDGNAPMLLRGEIVAVEWVNPHTRIYVTGASPDGRGLYPGISQAVPVSYMLWAATPNSLRRNGVGADILKPGVPVIVRAYRDKSRACPFSEVTGAPTCLAEVRDITLTPGGQRYFVGPTGHDAPSDGADPADRGPPPAAGAPKTSWCSEPKAG